MSALAPYQFVAATFADPTIPGGGYIVDASHAPMAAIAQDGNIYTLTS